MKYKNRKRRGRLRPLDVKDRRARAAHNKRTHRTGKVWAHKHVVREKRTLKVSDEYALSKRQRLVQGLLGKKD